MELKTVEDIKNIAGQRVLLRDDFNVPLDEGKVKDDYKIRKSLPTIEYLMKKGAKIILVSHLGRPEGWEKKLSLAPVAKVLSNILKKEVRLLKISSLENYLEEAKEESKKMLNGEVILLENIRFFPGEEKNDQRFAKDLAQLADLFVLDGFAVVHRNSASVSGVANYLPAYGGLLLKSEINGLSRITEKKYELPFVFIVGGVKMETKIPILKKLMPLASQVLVGGGIFNTYLWAKGYQVGNTLIDINFKEEALFYLNKKQVVKPIDLVVGDKNGVCKVIDVKADLEISPDSAIYDIGPKTIKLFSNYIREAKTLVWNGALGYFEQKPYNQGTEAIAKLIALNRKVFSVCGGGETVELLQKLDLVDKISLVSTGGGAMLEFLSGKKLPGLKKLY